MGKNKDKKSSDNGKDSLSGIKESLGGVLEPLQEFFSGIGDTLQSVYDDILYRLPPQVADNSELIVPGLAVLLSVFAIFFAAGAFSTSTSIENSITKYLANKEKLESTLSIESSGISFEEEGEDALSRSDLLLQYGVLTDMDTLSSFSSAETTAKSTENEEAKVNSDAAEAYIEAIKEFVGTYGGLVIRNTYSDMSFAAYLSSSEMEAPDSGINNVLLETLSRTDENGDSNPLIILSARDVVGITAITEGSFMYTYFGEEDDEIFSANTYVCTGVETGSLDVAVVYENTEKIEDEEEEIIEEEIEENETELDAATASNNSVSSIADDGTVTLTDGTIIASDGTVYFPDGTVVSPDGTVTYSDGVVVSPDGTISDADDDDTESATESDSSSSSSSTITKKTSSSDDEDDEDDSEEDEDGTTSSNKSSASDDEDSDDDDTSDEDESDESDDEYNDSENEEDDENNEDEDTDDEDDEEEENEDDSDYDFGTDSVFDQNVYAADGSLMVDNTVSSLILYNINSKTGTVTITYWSLASESLVEND